MSHRSTLRVRVRAAAFVVLLLQASTVTAQDVPFAFLIVNGWKSFYAGHAFRNDQNLTSWYGRGQIHVIVNGQKGADIGTAHMHAFVRTVPDPAFSGIRPLAGLIAMNFGSYRAHLTVIETPAGLRTTVAFQEPSGLSVDYRVSGTWVLGDGSGIGGGTSDDLVVGGIVHFGFPNPAATLTLMLWPYFPQVLFHNDPPLQAFQAYSPLPWQVGIGSSYVNTSSGPVRTYMRTDAGAFFDDFTSVISVLHTGGDNYVIVSFSMYFATPKVAFDFVPGCTASGVGPTLGRLTGRAVDLTLVQNAIFMQWSLYLAP